MAACFFVPPGLTGQLGDLLLFKRNHCGMEYPVVLRSCNHITLLTSAFVVVCVCLKHCAGQLFPDLNKGPNRLRASGQSSRQENLGYPWFMNLFLAWESATKLSHPPSFKLTGVCWFQFLVRFTKRACVFCFHVNG